MAKTTDNSARDVAEPKRRKRGPRSEKPQKIMDWLSEWFSEHDYPPAIRDIVSGCKMSSTSVVDYNLKILEREGKIKRDRTRARTITLVEPEQPSVRVVEMPELSIPVVGAIAAGTSTLLTDVHGGWGNAANVEDHCQVTSDMVSGRNDPEVDKLFAVTVRGDSLRDAMVLPRDTVILEHDTQISGKGELVAVYMRDEEVLTLKRLYREDGRIRLQPENSTMEPIYTTEENIEIQGRVVSVIRRVN